MIICFNSNLQMTVDKNADASNNFALAHYDSPTSVFKANAVVEGKTMLLTHAHVTENARKLTNVGYYTCSSTRRKDFLKNYHIQVENAICTHLRGTRNYSGPIKLRFKIGESSLDLFKSLGYTKVETCNNHYWDAARYVIVEKQLQ